MTGNWEILNAIKKQVIPIYNNGKCQEKWHKLHNDDISETFKCNPSRGMLFYFKLSVLNFFLEIDYLGRI